MKNRVIVWRITQDCNMKCRFCSYSHEVNRQRDNADEAEISRLIKILIEYRKTSGDNILISWIGGEPFLWMNIIKYSKQLADNGIGVSTTTNGLLLLKDEIRKDICRYFDEIVFSIDGLAECNDDVRQFPGHFKIVSENIKAIDLLRKSTKSSLKLKVNTILMQRNIEGFENFCEYLLTLGVDELTFNQLGGYDRPEFFEANRLLTAQVEDFIAKLTNIKRKFAERGFIIHGSKRYTDRILMTTRNEKNPIDECDPAAWFWFINENGLISPCSYTSYEYKFNTKNIRATADIDQVETYFREQRVLNRSKWCDDCYCTQVYDKFQ